MLPGYQAIVPMIAVCLLGWAYSAWDYARYSQEAVRCCTAARCVPRHNVKITVHLRFTAGSTYVLKYFPVHRVLNVINMQAGEAYAGRIYYLRCGRYSGINVRA